MILNGCPVCFDAETHTYTLGGRELSGITALLRDKLFPTTYDGVDAQVLANAAAYGSAVHRMCERYDTLGEYPDNEDLHAYVELKVEEYLTHQASEYLVSDLEHYASCIDKVYYVDENTVDIADIKTTYKFDKEYVSWQLSIYAYLFERQNPTIKVRNLYGLHLRRGEGKMIEVVRKDDLVVEALLYRDIEIDPYAMPEVFKAAEDEIARFTRLVKHYTEKLDILKDGIRKEMERVGATRWEGDKVQIIRRAGSTSTKFDAKRYEAEHPEECASYMKETKTKGSITIKLKEE